MIDWIRQTGIVEYEIGNKDKLLGDHRCSYWVNTIIMITKRTISHAKNAVTIPNIYSVKNNVFEIHSHGTYKFSLIDKEDILEKRWSMHVKGLDRELVR